MKYISIWRLFMGEIVLKEITKENWLKAVSLKVHDSQTNFIASNAFSLAQSKYADDCYPMGIYNEEEMIGFLMWGIEPGTGHYWIIRFMIDKNFQGKGFGRLAMQEIIRLLSSMPQCNEITLSYAPENIAAQKLYREFGFIETGEMDDDEVIARLKL